MPRTQESPHELGRQSEAKLKQTPQSQAKESVNIDNEYEYENESISYS